MKVRFAIAALFLCLCTSFAHAEFTWKTWIDYRNNGLPKMQADVLHLYVAAIASTLSSVNGALEYRHDRKLYCLKDSKKVLQVWDVEQLLDYAQAGGEAEFAPETPLSLAALLKAQQIYPCR
ncbi:hypothetical protein GO290_02734 [Ralstonia solanacearum]|nr:hypothetical protein [Ralstonia solanacearum]